MGSPSFLVMGTSGTLKVESNFPWGKHKIYKSQYKNLNINKYEQLRMDSIWME